MKRVDGEEEMIVQLLSELKALEMRAPINAWAERLESVLWIFNCRRQIFGWIEINSRLLESDKFRLRLMRPNTWKFHAWIRISFHDDVDAVGGGATWFSAAVNLAGKYWRQLQIPARNCPRKVVRNHFLRCTSYPRHDIPGVNRSLESAARNSIPEFIGPLKCHKIKERSENCCWLTRCWEIALLKWRWKANWCK